MIYKNKADNPLEVDHYEIETSLEHVCECAYDHCQEIIQHTSAEDPFLCGKNYGRNLDVYIIIYFFIESYSEV